MSYEDTVEDVISNSIYAVLSASTPAETASAYKKFKVLSQKQQQRHWRFIKESFKDFDECYFYNVLDRVIGINDDECRGTDAVDLAKFLLADSALTEYCKSHIEYDGVPALLKYKAKIMYKNDLIAEAILLAQCIIYKIRVIENLRHDFFLSATFKEYSVIPTRSAAHPSKR